MSEPLQDSTGDVIDAVFRPDVLDDLKPGMEEWIGRREQWQALWKITDEDGGPYVGQHAWTPLKPGSHYGVTHPEFPYIWVPTCDLERGRKDA